MVTFDYPGRIARYQASLAEQGAIAGLVLKPANVRYLCGFWGYATRAEYSEPRRLICLVVPARGRPLLVVPKIEFVFARRATADLGLDVRRHVEWKEEGETEDSWGIVRGFLGENGITGGRLAIERDYLAHRAWTAIEAAFGGFELHSTSGLIEQMRVIKDPAELALMRRCGDVAVGQLETEIAAITRGGLREYEIAMIGWEYVVRRCAEVMDGNEVNSPLGEGVQLVTSGPRLAMSHGSASTRRIAPDDVVMMDFCRVPYLLGYRIGLGRVATQRRLTSEEEDIEATIQQAYRVGLSYVRPGVTCSEIDSAIRAVLVKGGLAEFVVHRNGRGLGIESVELPEIKEGIDTPLQAGMVVSIEPSIYRDGFAARVEDTMVVTAGGPEILTRAPAEMRRITR
jgi:Xaa-Pro aminopeptidase